MYTAEQLATMKRELEAGKPLPRILTEQQIPREGNPREALFEAYGRDVIQEIIRTKVRPNLPAGGGAGQRPMLPMLERLVERLTTQPSSCAGGRSATP